MVFPTQDPVLEGGQSPEQGTPAAGAQQSGGSTPPTQTTDWEGRFKGLQASAQEKADKLNTTISNLQSQIASLTSDLDKTRGDSGMLASEKEKLEKAQADLQSQLQSISAERDNNNKQLEQLKLVMGEFPQLSPLSKYIPSADDLESFRGNAKDFYEAIEKIVQERVTQTLKGASPPVQADQSKIIEPGEEDALWERVYRTAGVVGKEEDYRKAYNELQAVIAAKKSS